MPKIIQSSTTPYDLATWRKRCELTQEQAAEMLGVSTSKLWRIENAGRASKEMLWACYGIERHIYDQKAAAAP